MTKLLSIFFIIGCICLITCTRSSYEDLKVKYPTLVDVNPTGTDKNIYITKDSLGRVVKVVPGVLYTTHTEILIP
jgi:hypothetical protein